MRRHELDGRPCCRSRAVADERRPVRLTARPDAQVWKRLARDRGLAYDARPRQLDVWDWVALFEARYSSPS